MAAVLDIVIPVYREGANIARTLSALAREVRTPCRVLICHDTPDDDTLPAIAQARTQFPDLPIDFVLNSGTGAHGAIMGGFAASTAPYVVVYPADDDYNAGILDAMVARAQSGCAIVCASRFMPGGSMVGCPPVKAVVMRTANWTLLHLARVPSCDATNGFRLFSRKVIDRLAIESQRGFCYSIELLVKCHRLGWPVGEVAARWFERRHGTSRFRVLDWAPDYLRWYGYAFATTYLRRPPASVAQRPRPRPDAAGA
jgi:glycosyltransferase involved in cell wall biosynthesis